MGPPEGSERTNGKISRSISFRYIVSAKSVAAGLREAPNKA